MTTPARGAWWAGVGGEKGAQHAGTQLKFVPGADTRPSVPWQTPTMAAGRPCLSDTPPTAVAARSPTRPLKPGKQKGEAPQKQEHTQEPNTHKHKSKAKLHTYRIKRVRKNNRKTDERRHDQPHSLTRA